MHDFVEQILERPKNQKIGIWVGSIVVLSLLCWQFLYNPVSKSIIELNEKIEKLETNIEKQRYLIKNLPKFKEEVGVLDKKLELALYALPDDKQIPDFIRSLGVLAKDSGLDIAKISREQPQIEELFASVPVRLDLQGSYHKLATFFDEVGHLTRIVNIKDVNINLVSENNREVVLRVSCIMTIFRYLSDSERAEIERRKEKSKKRKR